MRNFDKFDVFATIRVTFLVLTLCYFIGYIVNWQDNNYDYLGVIVSEQHSVAEYDKDTHKFKEYAYLFTYRTDDGENVTVDFGNMNDYKKLQTSDGQILYKNNTNSFMLKIFIFITVYVCVIAYNIWWTDSTIEGHWGNPLKIFNCKNWKKC